MKRRVRVVVVDDSSICRDVLRELLEEEGDIEVVGEAADGDEAYETVARLRPDAVTLDIEMPRTDGLSAIRRIMADCPTPILVVTGRPAPERSHTLFEAVRRGALDLFPKPSAHDADQAHAFRVLVRRMASVPVVRHLRTRSMRSPVLPLPPPVVVAPRPGLEAAASRVRVIGIGASAGGPAAVATVLRGLPGDLEASVVIVQHLLTGFTRPFSDFLRHHTKLEVRVVEEASLMAPGTVYVAPDDRHLIATAKDQLVPFDGPPSGGHRPSVDVLFQSLANVHGKGAAGVILSGMGEDGARGLKAMSAEGALTLAQSEESCAVYGMPRAAVLLGAARRQLPLLELAGALALATQGGGGS